MPLQTPSDTPPPEPDDRGGADESDDPMDKPVGAGIDFTDPNSRLAPYYFRATDVLAMLVIAALMVLYGHFPLFHTDVWAHLKLGSWMTEHRQWPDREPFSPYTADTYGAKFAWLTQVLYDRVYVLGQRLAGGEKVRQFLGGGEMLRGLHTAAIVASAFLFWLAYRRVTGGSSKLALLGLILFIYVIMTKLSIHRPQQLGVMCFAGLVAILSRPELARRHVAFIALLMVLWANLHGSFVAGFGLLGLFWLGRGIEAWLTATGRPWRAVFADRQFRMLTAAAVASTVAVALINPDGPRIFTLTASFGSHPNLKTLTEWMPIDFTEPLTGYQLYLLSLLLVVGVLAASPTPPRPVEVLVVIVFGLASLYQRRMLSWWLPMAVWVMLPHLRSIADGWGWRVPGTTPSFKKTALAVVLLGIAVLLTPLSKWVQTGQPAPPNQVYYPGTPLDLVATIADPTAETGERMKPLAKALRERYAGRPVGVLFTTETIGDLFYWRQIPGCQPLMFTHAHLYRESNWYGGFAAENGFPGWWEYLDRHRANLIAAEPDSHSRLVAAVIARPDEWEVVLNESGTELLKSLAVQKVLGGPAATAYEFMTRFVARDERARLFVAVRKTPK
jgi:hypothetical protein